MGIPCMCLCRYLYILWSNYIIYIYQCWHVCVWYPLQLTIPVPKWRFDIDLSTFWCLPPSHGCKHGILGPEAGHWAVVFFFSWFLHRKCTFSVPGNSLKIKFLQLISIWNTKKTYVICLPKYKKSSQKNSGHTFFFVTLLGPRNPISRYNGRGPFWVKLLGGSSHS